MTKEKPLGVPAREETHREIKAEAAVRGLTMVDLMDRIWTIYKKHVKSNPKD